MRHPGRSLYGDAPQVHAVNRRHVLVHERRFGHQPEQPRLQARPPAPRCAGTGMQNRFGQPHLVARTYRCVFAGYGTLRSRYRQQRMAILLPRGARLVPLRDSRHYPEGRGNAARHREMACTRRPLAPSASNGPGLLRSVLPLYDGAGIPGTDYLARIKRTLRRGYPRNHMERPAAQREIGEARHRMVPAGFRPLLGRTTDPAIRDA